MALHRMEVDQIKVDSSSSSALFVPAIRTGQFACDASAGEVLTLCYRSMESHLRLAAANYPVISFGTGSLVRLPGPSISQPNVYQFNKTSYDSMYKELEAKDPRLYRANGILNMLGRNRGVKWGPER